MGRYANSGYLQAALDKENEQEQLKAKHNLEEKDVVVVEKTSIFKYLLIVLRSVFSVLLFGLGAVGAFTLLYPSLRENFLSVLFQVIDSIGG